MYFDIQPKLHREDLFGTEFALSSLIRHLKDPSTRLVVIKGLRRTGKTSLLNVALQEASLPAVKIDVRESPYYDRQEFHRYLVQKIKRAWGESLFEKVAKNISGVGISYKDWSATVWGANQENVMLFWEKMDAELRKKKMFFVLALDEAQLLKPIEFDYLLASIFDNYRNIKCLITGSEIGLLDSFIGKQDYAAPLFGRAYAEIELQRMKAEETSAFLEQGFRQIGKKIAYEEIKEVIEYLDGIIGWITHYGWLRYQGSSPERALEKVQQEGKEIVRKELGLFLEKRKAKDKYRRVLHCLSRGLTSWNLIKQAFAKEKIKIMDSQLHRYLAELRDYSFVEKSGEDYVITDPLLLKAVKED